MAHTFHVGKRSCTPIYSSLFGQSSLAYGCDIGAIGLIAVGCVHSHDIPEKAHMLESQVCQAKLGTIKRVRHGSISLEDYCGQSLEAARQVGAVLFMTRINH